MNRVVRWRTPATVVNYHYYEPCSTEKNHSRRLDHFLTHSAFPSLVSLPFILRSPIVPPSLGIPSAFSFKCSTTPFKSCLFLAAPFFLVTLSGYRCIYLHSSISAALSLLSSLLLSPSLLSSLRHIFFSAEGVVGLTGSELTVVTLLPPCQARRHLRVWLQIE